MIQGFKGFDLSLYHKLKFYNLYIFATFYI